MPFKEPFTLGPFSVDVTGRLSLAHADAVPRFSVRWRGKVVHACLAARASGTGALTIHTSLGRIPSTATDPATRATCLAMLPNVAQSLPEAWTFQLGPDHQRKLSAEATIDLPVTAASLVTEMTAFLLDLSPYLDLMEQAGGRTGCDQPGQAGMPG